MDTSITPKSACLFGKLVIQLERFDSCTPTSGQADNDCAIVTPPKMSCPLLTTGIK
jgi:hypothetical protein